MPQYWTDFERNPFMWITGEPEIGEDTWIGPFTVIDAVGGLSIGDSCAISAGAHLYTHEMITPGREAGEIERASVTVGDSVYIGANAVINMGCVIEDGATVGAGAVVPKHTTIGSGETWVGVPAAPVND